MYLCDTKVIAQAKTDICIPEKNYKSNMENKVLPFINKHKQTGFFTGVDNVNLFYEKFDVEDPKAYVVIIHGFSEHSRRYDELIYYYLKENYTVYIYDQRCHGLSDRLTNYYNMIYVKDFDDYARDLKIFLDKTVRETRQDKKIFLYCHSMGGTVVTRFFEIYQPSNIELVIMSAPMLGLITKPYSQRVADLISDNKSLSGKEKKYCLGHSDFDPENRPDKKIYDGYIRYEYNAGLEAQNLKLATSGASFGWVKQAMMAIKKVFDDDNIRVMNRINTKFHMFQYGNDKTVSSDDQNRFVTLVNNCELYKIDSSEHNIYFMNNDVFSLFLHKMFEIFNYHLGSHN